MADNGKGKGKGKNGGGKGVWKRPAGKGGAGKRHGPGGAGPGEPGKESTIAPDGTGNTTYEYGAEYTKRTKRRKLAKLFGIKGMYMNMHLQMRRHT